MLKLIYTTPGYCAQAVCFIRFSQHAYYISEA